MTLLTKFLPIGLLALGIIAGVQTWRLDVERADHKLTRHELAAAELKAQEWKNAEAYRQTQTAAQQALGKACLDREAAAEADVALRTEIMRAAPPVAVTKEQEKRGVSRETRRTAADYLNRPL